MNEPGAVLNKKRIRSETRNKNVECMICLRKMRSDTLKRHIRKHRDIYSLNEKDMREEIKERKRQYDNKEARKRLVREIALQENAPMSCIEEDQGYGVKTLVDEKGLEEDLYQDNQKYLENIELGKKISTILDKGVIREESLTKERKDALGLYRKQRPHFDILNVQLRPWQEQALKLVEKPSERNIIWILGRHGNEGKTWFQCYIESYFGFHRVARVDLRIKHASVCQVLKKRSLSSIDIFLFNDSRSVSGEEINLYRILEDIKDGQATTSKYDNDNIRFKTPNTVMIFSNQYPNVQKLSSDRWQIYHANQDGLNDLTLQTLKKM